MLKKAEMAIGVVIAVAIGLLILIVLAVVLFGGGKKWETGTACTNAGGVCVVNTANSQICNEDQTDLAKLKMERIDNDGKSLCPGTIKDNKAGAIHCCKNKIDTNIMGN